jgi:hypothetical protein
MTRHAMFDGFRWTPARQRPAGPRNYGDSALNYRIVTLGD